MKTKFFRALVGEQSLASVDTSALRAERARRDWTQADVAKKIGTVASVISALESGQRMPGLRALVKIQRLFPEAVQLKSLDLEEVARD